MYEVIHWICCPRWIMGELWGEVFDRRNINLNGMWGSQMGGHHDDGAAKISSDKRAPLNIEDALWAMCWSVVRGDCGIGWTYKVIWARIWGSARSFSGNIKVIVGISLLGMMAGPFIGWVGINILGVFLLYHFWNMWKAPILCQWLSIASISHHSSSFLMLGGGQRKFGPWTSFSM